MKTKKRYIFQPVSVSIVIETQEELFGLIKFINIGLGQSFLESMITKIEEA